MTWLPDLLLMFGGGLFGFAISRLCAKSRQLKELETDLAKLNRDVLQWTAESRNKSGTIKRLTAERDYLARELSVLNAQKHASQGPRI